MTYTLNGLAESLAERAGRQFDIPFREQIKLWILLWRSRLLRDTLNRKPEDRTFYQSSLVIPLVPTDLFAECGKVLRTKCKVPKPVRANSILFDYVGSVTMTHSFQVVQPHTIPFISASKYTGKRPKAVYMDEYIYIFNAGLLKELRLHGIFEDLTQVDRGCVTSISGNPAAEFETCDLDDAPFPVSLDLQQQIIQAIISTELRQLIPQTDTEVNLTNEDIGK